MLSSLFAWLFSVLVAVAPVQTPEPEPVAPAPAVVTPAPAVVTVAPPAPVEYPPLPWESWPSCDEPGAIATQCAQAQLPEETTGRDVG